MDLIQALLLGVLQGITEWLPISSQGQVLATAVAFMGLSVEEASRHAILLHIGTLISAIAYFRKELLGFVLKREQRTARFVLAVLLFSAVTGIPLYLLFRNFAVGSAILLLIGLFLIASGIMQHKAREWKLMMGGKYAAVLGLAQGFAVLPGISRSGITTAVLLLQDFEPEQAFRISFLISIPSILAGELLFGLFEGSSILIDFNAIAAIAAATVVGYATIGLLLRLARRINFVKFCLGFGAFYILIALLQMIL